MHGQKCSAWRAITQRGFAMSRTRDCQSCTEVRGQRSSWLCKRATSRAKAPAGEPWAMGRCVGVALTDLLDAICERLQRRSRGNDGECFRKGRFGQQISRNTQEREGANGPFDSTSRMQLQLVQQPAGELDRRSFVALLPSITTAHAGSRASWSNFASDTCESQRARDDGSDLLCARSTVVRSTFVRSRRRAERALCTVPVCEVGFRRPPVHEHQYCRRPRE